jgi:hypothetical protein
MEASGNSWDTTVYAGIREFHESKGFDSYSQEVAVGLGVPLYKLSNEEDIGLVQGKPSPCMLIDLIVSLQPARETIPLRLKDYLASRTGLDGATHQVHPLNLT